MGEDDVDDGEEQGGSGKMHPRMRSSAPWTPRVRALGSRVDYLGMMAASTNSTTSCAFPTGAPDCAGEVQRARRFDDSPEFDIVGADGDKW